MSVTANLRHKINYLVYYLHIVIMSYIQLSLAEAVSKKTHQLVGFSNTHKLCAKRVKN